jgi:hypothetical protein
MLLKGKQVLPCCEMGGKVILVAGAPSNWARTLGIKFLKNRLVAIMNAAMSKHSQDWAT